MCLRVLVPSASWFRRLRRHLQEKCYEYRRIDQPPGTRLFLRKSLGVSP